MASPMLDLDDQVLALEPTFAQLMKYAALNNATDAPYVRVVDAWRDEFAQLWLAWDDEDLCILAPDGTSTWVYADHAAA
jgi:hypothetical protein